MCPVEVELLMSVINDDLLMTSFKLQCYLYSGNL